MTYKLYIGSNNQTKQLELTKIKKCLGLYFTGATIYNCLGYYKGSEEKTAILEISTQNKSKIYQLIKVLKQELKQDSIGLQRLPSLSFV